MKKMGNLIFICISKFLDEKGGLELTVVPKKVLLRDDELGLVAKQNVFSINRKEWKVTFFQLFFF